MNKKPPDFRVPKINGHPQTGLAHLFFIFLDLPIVLQSVAFHGLICKSPA